ncbi:GntR family transcriptional regulator [Tsukamurella sp. 8F]|uniref:GntR family transcriptional regulator n=1 Tax=unclassified Tsukamurella TaxID=2633480 RepID=UPI0023B944AB|nr:MULTISPECIES: GntR family transcriptional regulator [unclassified Tsukamurella]MDF0528910.1 GntR family transcriptional regulator [Tsukamurella sp. 8J]MDF0586745.1 GntR family transcriptional regulator [Tsukamurella sp. 8F]
MDVYIDPLSSDPIYQQIRDRIVEAVAAGRLKAGAPLVAVRTLAAAFGINPATVAKAYNLLREEGIVATNRKSGSVIARDPSSGPPRPGFDEAWRGRLQTLLAEGTAHGLPEDRILDECRSITRRFIREEDA